MIYVPNTAYGYNSPASPHPLDLDLGVLGVITSKSKVIKFSPRSICDEVKITTTYCYALYNGSASFHSLSITLSIACNHDVIQYKQTSAGAMGCGKWQVM
jgi:hypothetical protein